MKHFTLKHFAFIIFLLSFHAAIAQDTTRIPAPKAIIQFETQVFDHNTIPQGESVRGYFFFKNIGTEPLIIVSAQSSCGCLVPDYPREPIMPGQCGMIRTLFSTTGKAGPQDKTVTVRSNASNDIIIHVKGFVKYYPKPENRSSENMFGTKKLEFDTASYSPIPAYPKQTTYKIDKLDLNAGMIGPSETKTFTFTLTNTGKSKLYYEMELPQEEYKMVTQQKADELKATAWLQNDCECKPKKSDRNYYMWSSSAKGYIDAGKSRKITIEVSNPVNKTGAFTKTITLKTNSAVERMITIKGTFTN